MMKPKIGRYFLINFFLLAIIFYGFAACGWTNPLKVTDPTDPRFNINSFRFTDYQRKDALYDALTLLLKPGMSMREVDRILVEAGGATKTFVGNDEINKFRYYYRPWYTSIRSALAMHPFNGWSVFVKFDQDDQVESLVLKGF